jgi:ligand-binding sensor domain-containing protein
MTAAANGPVRTGGRSALAKVLQSVRVGLLLLAGSQPAQALDAANLLTQYAHSGWTPQENGFTGTPLTISQTSDGYVWIGTTAGLIRFDGVKFVKWTPPAGQELPSPYVDSLLATSDGALWIGTQGGLSRWQSGQLYNYPGGPGSIDAVSEDANSVVWVGRGGLANPDARVCRVDGARLHCDSSNDGLALPTTLCCVFSLLKDTQGNLWIGGDTGLVRWSAAGSTLYQPEVLQTNQRQVGVLLAETHGGILLVGMARAGRGGGLQMMVDGVLKPFVVPGFDCSMLEVTSIYVDRNEAIWIGTPHQGLFRIHGRRVDHYQHSDGLTSDNVFSILEDREGDVWVTTSRGLDNFRDLRVTSFSRSQGLTDDEVDSVLASRDGTLWIGTSDGLNVLRDGVLSAIRAREGLPGHQVTSMLEDHAGRLWVGSDTEMSVYENGRFNLVRRPNGSPLGMVVGMAEDAQHDFWLELASEPRKLLHLRDRGVVEEISSPPLPPARKVLADARDGVWLGMSSGDLLHYQQHSTQVFSYPRSTSRPSPPVIQMQAGGDGSVYGATEAGVIAWRNGVQRTMTNRNGLPCTVTFALVFDLQRNLWLYMECGLVEVCDAGGSMAPRGSGPVYSTSSTAHSPPMCRSTGPPALSTADFGSPMGPYCR